MGAPRVAENTISHYRLHEKRNREDDVFSFPEHTDARGFVVQIYWMPDGWSMCYARTVTRELFAQYYSLTATDK